MRQEALHWHQQTERQRSIAQHKRSVTIHHSRGSTQAALALPPESPLFVEAVLSMPPSLLPNSHRSNYPSVTSVTMHPSRTLRGPGEREREEEGEEDCELGASKPYSKTARHTAALNRGHGVPPQHRSADWDLMLEAAWSTFDKALTCNSHVHTIQFNTLLTVRIYIFTEEHYYFYAPFFPRFPQLCPKHGVI